MAVLGYCPTCGKLTPIVAGEYKLGLRERRWTPVLHEDPSGKLCPNRKSI